jgi:cystathionine beta-synthase
MSNEKVYVLKALGAEIIRTPTEAAYDAPDSHISVARRLNDEIPNSHILDQYGNPSNPLAHYDGTAEELLTQTGNQIDMIVCGAGTGGTISGIAKKLKEKCPSITVVAVDPVGSILAVPDKLNDYKRLESYAVEGIGYDFIPDVLDRELVDVWTKSDDKESLVTMRQMIREEGLLCGGSCGAAMSQALKEAKKLKAGQKCVVVLPDSVRNYMTKALSDDWMIDNGFADDEIIKHKKFQQWWADKKISDLEVKTPLTITDALPIRGAIGLLKDEGFDMVPVVNSSGDVIGVVTEGNMTAKLLSGRVASTDPVSKVLYKTFKKVGMGDSLGMLAGIFDHEPFALVTTEQRLYSAGPDGGKTVKTKSVVSGIVSRIDLLDFISVGEAK